MAGYEVNDYINSLDIEKFKTKKEKTLKDNKEKVLNEANILLILDIQDDYDELIKYGFKNVDYFKSIIRADSYFAKHPKELEKYHIILEGNQNVQQSEGNVELERIINKMKYEKRILETYLHRYDYPDHMELSTYLQDNMNYRDWHEEELTYHDIFDRIVENMLINHTLEKVDLKNIEFVPIQDEINPNRLPLPTIKSNLKILYLDNYLGNARNVNGITTRIAEELQLNITFKKDDNSSLGKYVKAHLGDYDIIITSYSYSGNLLNMNVESTEQCKDTGRELTLLASYRSVFENNIRLIYRFGGNLAPNSEKYLESFSVLTQPIETKAECEYQKKYDQIHYSNTKAIIEAIVNFYNQALIKIGKPAISDIDFKTAKTNSPGQIKERLLLKRQNRDRRI